MDTSLYHRRLGVFSIENLYEKYRPKLLVFFLKKGLGEEVAEDLTQEVFFRLLRSKKPFDDEDYVRNLLYRIASNLAIDHFRKNGGSIQVRTLSRENLAEEGHPSLIERSSGPEEHYIAGETSGDVHSVISNLPERYAEAIFLKEYQGLSYREMADKLGVSEKAVESLLHRARAQLKSDLREVGKRRGGWWSGIAIGLRGMLGRGLRRCASPRRWIPRKLHRLYLGTGSVGSVKAVFNLVMAVLIVGMVVSSGVAVSVFASAKPDQNRVEKVVNAAEVLDQRVEGMAQEEGKTSAQTPEDPPLELEHLNLAPVIEEQCEEEGVVQPLCDILTQTSDTTRYLLKSTGEALDKVLGDLGDLLGRITDPLFGVLSLIGIPSGIIEPIEQIIGLGDAREISGDLVDLAVEATYVVDNAVSALSGLDVRNGILEPSVALPETAVPDPRALAGPLQEETDTETVEPGEGEREEEAAPVQEPAAEEGEEAPSSEDNPGENNEGTGNGLIELVEDLADILLPF